MRAGWVRGRGGEGVDGPRSWRGVRREGRATCLTPLHRAMLEGRPTRAVRSSGGGRKRRRGGEYALPSITPARNHQGRSAGEVNHSVQSLAQINTLTSMLKKLETCNMPPTEGTSFDASFHEALSPFAPAAATTTPARHQRHHATSNDQRHAQKTRLLTFQWSRPAAQGGRASSRGGVVMPPPPPSGRSEVNALSLFEASVEDLPAKSQVRPTTGPAPEQANQASAASRHRTAEETLQQMQDTNRLVNVADPTFLYDDLKRLRRKPPDARAAFGKKQKPRLAAQPLPVQPLPGNQRDATSPKMLEPRTETPLLKPSERGLAQTCLPVELPEVHAIAESKSLPCVLHTPGLKAPLQPPIPRNMHAVFDSLEYRQATPHRRRDILAAAALTPLAPSALFTKAHRTNKRDYDALTDEIRSSIDEFSKCLPEAMVVRFGMGKEARRRAMANFERIFSAWVLRCFIRPRYDKWVWFKENAIFLEQTAASIVMQQYVRCFICKCRLHRKRLLIRAQRRQAQADLLEYIEMRRVSTVLLQRTVRGNQGRKRAARKRLERTSAGVIQRFWLAMAAKRLCAKMRYKRDKEWAAASKIQRCWWGYRGRRQFWRDVKTEKANVREKKLEVKEYVMRHGFERLGAALKLQRWWKNLLWRKSFTQRIIMTEKNRCAVLIQRQVRRLQGLQRYISFLKKYVSGENLNFPPNMTLATPFMKRMATKALVFAWTTKAERRVAFPPVRIDLIKTISRKPPGQTKAGDPVFSKTKPSQPWDPDESFARAPLIYWRRRGDRYLVRTRKRIGSKRNKMSAADRRILSSPFDYNAIQIAGAEALSKKRYKRAALLLRRAMLYEENALLAHGFERYFASRRCGSDLLREMHDHPLALDVDDQYLGEDEFWALCGTAHFKHWEHTRSFKALEYAYESFQIALTYANNITEEYLLASAKVATQWGDFESGLQSLAAYITEYPTGRDLSNVIFLAASALKEAGSYDQAFEYFNSLMNNPPPGLKEAHILLQIARTRLAQGYGHDALAAAQEIFQVRKRRRQIPFGVGTMQAYFGRTETWMTFAKEYEETGHDLAAADSYSEALRIALAEDWNAVSVAFPNSDVAGGAAADLPREEEARHAPEISAVNYVPKEGYSIEQVHAAALRIQSRYRVHRGQLAFHLKRQAKKALEKQLDKLQELSHVMYRTGRAWVHVGRVVEAVTLLNRVYELSGDTVRQTQRLAMTCPEEISEAFHESAQLMAHLRQAQDQARAYDPENAPLTPFFAALQIQRYFRRRSARLRANVLKRHRAARVLQYQWVTRFDRYGIGQFRARVKAARMLQKCYRNRLAHIFMREVNKARERKRIGATTQQKWYRRYLATRNMAKRRERLRVLFETLRVGHSLYLKSRGRLMARLFCDHSNSYCQLVVSPSMKFGPSVRYKQGKKASRSLLQILHYSITREDHTSSSTDSAQIGEQTFKNFLQQTTVLTKKLVQNKADIMFAKVMVGITDRGLDVARFYEVLIALGIARYGGGETTKKSPTRRRGSVQTQASPASPKRKLKRHTSFLPGDTVSSNSKPQLGIDDKFVYNGFRGDMGRVVKLLMECILTSKASWCKNAKVAIDAHIDDRVNSAALILQTWYRGVVGLACAKTYKQQLLKEAKLAKFSSAGIKIQTLWRTYTAKTRVQAIAKGSFRKFLDYESQTYYWWNPRTKRNMWTKPLVLGSSDINHVIEMPPPEQLYTLTCGQCSDTADRHCPGCDDDYCKECFKYLHAKGKAKQHAAETANLCAECGFQIASRICKTCDDYFCDWCFEMKHKAGRLRHHPWNHILPMCVACPPPRHEEMIRALEDVPKSVGQREAAEEDKLITQKVQYVARWHCVECDEELCNECYHREKHVGHTINAMGFQNEDIVKQRKLQAIAEEEARQQAEREAEQAKVELRLRTKAASYLQKVWRGRQHRMWGKKYMQDTRDERMVRFHANQKERRYRASAKYKVLVAGKLVFVKFPYFMYKLVRGKPISKAEREARAQSKLEEEEKMELLCLSSTQLDVQIQLEEGSENVTVVSKKWEDIKVVERGGEKGGRKIAANDRFRFVFDNVMHRVDSTIAALSKTDPHILVLSRPWDGPSTSDDMKVRVWWMPQITEDETNARHDVKVRKEKQFRVKADRYKRYADRLGAIADAFDEEGTIGKYLNRKVDSFDAKAEEFEAQLSGESPSKQKLKKAEGEEGRGGFDESKGRGEGLGVLGTVNLKMKMKQFRKKAHENQAGHRKEDTSSSAAEGDQPYESSAGGYYDESGNWIDESPYNGGYAEGGYYDDHDNWVETQQHGADGGYYDDNGYWINTTQS